MQKVIQSLQIQQCTHTHPPPLIPIHPKQCPVHPLSAKSHVHVKSIEVA